MNKKTVPFFLALAVLGLAAWLVLSSGNELASKTAEKSAVEDTPAASPEKAGAETPKTPPAPIDPATVATVRGVVRFEGVAPERKLVFMAGTADCKSLNPTPALEESLIVKDGKIQNVIVFVRKGLEGREFALPEEDAKKDVVLDQVACIYAPHVLTMRAGQTLQLHNSDTMLHNVHSDSKRNSSFNEPMPRKGDTFRTKLDKAEIFSLRCDVHSWMRSYVGVFSHPFYQLTAADGAFELKGLPPGKYTLRAWHELLGTVDLEIELGAKEEKTLDFTMKKN